MESIRNRHPRCRLICVGSELLRGKINTHASTLARRLASIGLSLSHEQTLADDQPSLAKAIEDSLRQAEVVIVTGGLGPTFDDLSREAASQATGCPLIYSKTLFKAIAAKFRRAAYRMPSTNARQAYLLEGAEAIPNPVGTAPGQWLDLKRGSKEFLASAPVLILLPGPPSELQPMLEASVLPRLKRFFRPRPRAETHLHFAGVAESLVDQRIRPLFARAKKSWGDDVELTILAKPGLVDLDIFVTASTLSAAAAKVRRIVAQVRRKMGGRLYGADGAFPLARVVQSHFVKKHMTLSVAESCTGGILAGALTDIPGSSDYFLGGVISYSDDLKRNLLGVPAALLGRHGAVSMPVARAMAEGVRRQTGSTWGIAITGVAGPGGGSSRKPVGLIFMALAGPRGTRGYEFHMKGYREAIRQRAVVAALDLLRNVRG